MSVGQWPNDGYEFSEPPRQGFCVVQKGASATTALQTSNVAIKQSQNFQNPIEPFAKSKIFNFEFFWSKKWNFYYAKKIQKL